MKTVIILAFALVAGVANAESISLICDGQALQKGLAGKTGKVVISVSGDVVETAPGYYGYADGYSFLVHWQDSTPILKGLGLTCGVATADASCAVEHISPKLKLAPFTIFEACGIGPFDTRGLPHQKFSSRLSLDHKLDHGQFYCAAHDENPVVATHVDLSNCRPN